MVQPGHGLGLGLEALPLSGAGSHGRGQDLDGAAHLQADVVGLVDHSHATLAEDALQLIAAVRQRAECLAHPITLLS